ncbi:TPA: hypothetical protein P6X17_002508 [Staphylococcus aureus]|nr:hypothetical protein [Staphylococcus aureus]MBH4643663.1 hypothetical protein [Staphylococcus aureus]MBH4650855.1 hypothetical protein [Staphylococcus aureus]MBH4666499.1 hypothetical protein [Staphylococcus aureus]MBH4668103.1 hypothetical protein [Staphylococcus aureus]MBH4671111.1 hypothetical protein [Staphylococcus aureus]
MRCSNCNWFCTYNCYNGSDGSGPIGWGVGTGMAALYAGGSIACNNM